MSAPPHFLNEKTDSERERQNLLKEECGEQDSRAVLISIPGAPRADLLELTDPDQEGEVSATDVDQNNGATASSVHCEDDEKTSSSLSTLEASSSGLAGSFEDGAAFRPDSNLPLEEGRTEQDDYGVEQPDPDWLNEQVQWAVQSDGQSTLKRDVTCSNLKGKLFVDKFGSGNRGKCIYGYHQWFTPTEFEAFAGKGQCKDWKRTIKAAPDGRPLLSLIEHGLLRVHAVSCSCSACWNGENDGPIRLHDTKRKGSQPSQQAGGFVTQKRHYTHARMVAEYGLEAVDSLPGKRPKTAATKSPSPPPTTSAAAPPIQQPKLSLVQSADGVLRLVTVKSGGSTNLSSLQGCLKLNGGNSGVKFVKMADGAFRLVVSEQQLQKVQVQPAAATAGALNVVSPQQAQVTSRQDSLETQSHKGVPLCLTYAPVKVVGPQGAPPAANKAPDLLSAGEEYLPLEESLKNLREQVDTLAAQLKAAKQASVSRHTNLLAKHQKEIDALKQKIVQLAVGNAGGGPPHGPGTKLCENCNRTASVTCAACQNVFYCGDFCVARDSANHRRLCAGKLPPPSSADDHLISIE